MEKKIIDFLVSHPEVSISGVEKQAGMPRRTLKYSIDGTRRIPEKYISGLVLVLSGYGLDVSGYEAGVCAKVADTGFVTSDTIVDSVSVDVNTGEVSQKKNAKVPPVKQKEVVTNDDLSQNVTGRTSHGYPMPDPVRLARARLVLAEMEHKMGITSYEDMNQPVFVKEVAQGKEELAVMAYKEATTVVPEGMVECVFIDDRIRRAVRYSGAYGYWDSHVVVDIADDEEVLISKTWRVMYGGNIGNRQITDGGKSIFYRDAISEGTIVYVPVGVFK